MRWQYAFLDMQRRTQYITEIKKKQLLKYVQNDTIFGINLYFCKEKKPVRVHQEDVKNGYSCFCNIAGDFISFS